MSEFALIKPKQTSSWHDAFTLSYKSAFTEVDVILEA